MNSPAPRAAIPEIRTTISGFGMSFSIAINTATIVITVKFIAPNASRTSMRPEQQAAQDAAWLRPCRHAARLFPCTREANEASGQRH